MKQNFKHKNQIKKKEEHETREGSSLIETSKYIYEKDDSPTKMLVLTEDSINKFIISDNGSVLNKILGENVCSRMP